MSKVLQQEKLSRVEHSIASPVVMNMRCSKRLNSSIYKIYLMLYVNQAKVMIFSFSKKKNEDEQNLRNRKPEKS